MHDKETLNMLVKDINDGEDAALIKSYLDRWLLSKREEIIGLIRICPVEHLVTARSMLQAVDLLVAQVNADIDNGKLATRELDEGGILYGN